MKDNKVKTKKATKSPKAAQKEKLVKKVKKPAPSQDNTEFTAGDHVVYPAHGVGLVEKVETETIGSMEVKLYSISFDRDRMSLKVPVFKAKTLGLRKVSKSKSLKDALETLKGRSRVRRVMWSRRAQEYETKINSGDPIAIAEVLRDLKRSNDEDEKSYSERQIYQSALERLSREVAAAEKISEEKAAKKLENLMGSKKAANDIEKAA